MSSVLKNKQETAKVCSECGNRSKVYRMFDVDGQHLEEYLVCLECGDGRPFMR